MHFRHLLTICVVYGKNNSLPFEDVIESSFRSHLAVEQPQIPPAIRRALAPQAPAEQTVASPVFSLWELLCPLATLVFCIVALAWVAYLQYKMIKIALA